MFSPGMDGLSSDQDHGRLSRRRFIAQLTATGLLAPALSRSAHAAPPATRMRLACQTNAWPFVSGLQGLIPVLETIKSLGFQGYETSYRNVQEAFSDPKPARDQLEETGLVCAGIHVAAPHLYEPETCIPPLPFLRKIADGSSALGAEYLILSGRGVGQVDGQLNRDILNQKIAALLEVAQYCHDLGLKLSYHNHADDFLRNGAELDALLSTGKSDLIGIWFCPHNADRAGAKVVEYFANHHQSVPGIHLTNILDNTTSGHPFDGEAIHAEIRKADWKGWLVIEEERTRERREWPETPVVMRSRQHVRQVFGL